MTICGWVGARAQATIAAQSVEKEFSEAQLAFSKATNFDDVPPKEKHVQFLLEACGRGGDGNVRGFVLEAIEKQVRTAKPWRTMLKTHVVLHRLLRECEGSEFKAEFFRYLEFLSRKAYGPKDQTLMNIRYWKDDANVDATELTGWTRAYAAYLEELCALNAHVPNIIGRAENGAAAANPLKDCDFATLIKVMPLLQTLVRRITDCEPKSTVVQKNSVSRFAAGLIAKDSFAIYRVMNEAIINLVDKYFETNRLDASKGLAIFKKFLLQIDDLQRFYDTCDLIGAFENGGKFGRLEAPPPTFLKSMEEYYETAPREGLPLRDRRLTASASVGPSTVNRAAAPLTVQVPTSNSTQDLLVIPAAPSQVSAPRPATTNVIAALSELALAPQQPQAVDPFSAFTAAPAPTAPAPAPAALAPAPAPQALASTTTSSLPTQVSALPPVSSSSNQLDFFGSSSAVSAPSSSTHLGNPFGNAPATVNPMDLYSAAAPPRAPAPSHGGNPYGGSPYGGNPYAVGSESPMPSPRGSNPFGDNPFGTPANKPIDRNALDTLYSNSPPSPRTGSGMGSMAPPQYINQSFTQQQQQQQGPQLGAAPQLALPAPGMGYAQQALPASGMGYAQQTHSQYGAQFGAAPQFGGPQFGGFGRAPAQQNFGMPRPQEAPMHPSFRQTSSAGGSPTAHSTMASNSLI